MQVMQVVKFEEIKYIIYHLILRKHNFICIEGLGHSRGRQK